MRVSVLILVVALAWCRASALDLPANYVSEDGTVMLFLDEEGGTVRAHLGFDGGIYAPVEGPVDGDRLSGTVAGIDVEAELGEEVVRLTLTQGGVSETTVLVRRVPSAEPPGGSGLMAMLALVPDTIAARASGVPGVSFVDLGAVADAGGAEGLRRREDLAAATEEERARWIASLRRVAAGPRELVMYAADMIETMPTTLGMEWFDIRRAVSYGAPPDVAILLAADVDPERLGAGLAERDFEVADLRGVSVWHRQEDLEMDMARRDRGDPFVGPLGMSVRIVPLPGHLSGTRTWAAARAVVATVLRSHPSLADSPDYRALAQALEATPGVLVQAMFQGPMEVGLAPADPLGPQPEAAREPLPHYALAAFADHQDGADQVASIALLYSDADTARRAAGILAARLAGYRSDELAALGARLDEPRMHTSDGGHVAAIASVRYPLPAAHGEGAAAGRALVMWLNGIVRRDFDILDIGP